MAQLLVFDLWWSIAIVECRLPLSRLPNPLDRLRFNTEHSTAYHIDTGSTPLRASQITPNAHAREDQSIRSELNQVCTVQYIRSSYLFMITNPGFLTEKP